MQASILVVGSLNVDVVARMTRLPRPGETVSAGAVQTFPGGKGANQAFAAARLGGHVRMVGRVGDDAFGRSLRENLATAGVDVSTVRTTTATPSGMALIFVETGGQNQIVLSAGANARLMPSDVDVALASANPAVVLLQLESPLETVLAAAAAGRRRGATVVLDPAPARPLPDELLGLVDLLTPNEQEARALLGGSPTPGDPPELAGALRDLGFGTVILTLGPGGAVVVDAAGTRRFEALPVDAVDTTGAGDTFNGALAVALAEQRGLDEAVAFAAAAATLSVTRPGAQGGAPARAEVDAMRP